MIFLSYNYLLLNLVWFGLFWFVLGVFFVRGHVALFWSKASMVRLSCNGIYGLVKLNLYLDPVSIFMYIS